MVVHLLAVLLALGLLAGPAPGPRDLVAPTATAALVDDAGDAPVAVVVGGPLMIDEPQPLDAPLASAAPVLYRHPQLVFRPPRVNAFN